MEHYSIVLAFFSTKSKSGDLSSARCSKLGKAVERPYGWVVVAGSLLLMTVGAGGYYVVIVGR